MIVNYKNSGTEDIFNGIKSKQARNLLPVELFNIAYRKLDMLDAANSIKDLRVPPGNHLEKMFGEREGQYSIRINDQYRICFVWDHGGPEQVEVVDYHE